MLNSFLILLVNELKLILREKVALFWIFLFPFFFMAIMLLSSGRNGMFGDQKIEIVDQDQTPTSLRYIAAVRQAFSAQSVVRANVTVLDRAPGDNAGIGVVRVTVPKGFAAAFATHSATLPVTVAYNYSSGFGTLVAAHSFTVLTSKFLLDTSGTRPPTKVDYVNTASFRPIGYLEYLLTGILVMSMMTSGMNNTCVAVVSQRERNTFKLMSCLPLSPAMYLAAMLVARVIILLLASVLLLVGGRYVYSVPMPLNISQYGSAAAVIVFGGVTLLSLGTAMASRISRVQTAMFVCNIVYLSLLFASDLTIPTSTYPHTVQRLVEVLPTAQFVHALRAILVQGSTLASQGPTLGVLSIWCVAALLFTLLTFRWHAQ